MSYLNTNDLAKKIELVNQVVLSFLPHKQLEQAKIMEAMEYSVSAGGKRVRPLLMHETYQLLGGQNKDVEPFMAALEFIHTYSLIHDDLPAMDNDDLRRGRPTSHIVYGEDIAILAGDSLLNYAFEIMSREIPKSENPKALALAMNYMANKAGIYGMIGGQVVDVLSEKSEATITEEKLLFIQENKTAALIQCAFVCPAFILDCQKDVISKLERMGYLIGVAFQIQDDILDQESTVEELGKPIGSDVRNSKLTYLSFHSIDEARKEVEKYSNEAISILNSFQGNSTFLEEFITSLIYRRK